MQLLELKGLEEEVKLVAEEAFLREGVTLGEGVTFLSEVEEVTYQVVEVMLEVVVTFQAMLSKLEEEANLELNCLKIEADWHLRMMCLMRDYWMFGCLFY